jgi:S-adenosylmethionine hydrolase
LPRKYSISKLHTSYGEVSETTILALFNSAGHLEIAINKGDSNASNGASGLLGIKIKDRISIEFT